MFRKLLMLTAIVLLFAASNLQAEQISCSWVGCEDGLWGDPGNWSCAMVPDNNETNTFIVTIDTSGCPNEVEVGLQQNRTIDQLDCYGAVCLESREWYLPDLTIKNGLTNHGSLDLELDIGGNVTNASGATLEMSDHLNIYGNLYNLAGATLIFGLEDIDIEGGAIENDGLIICGSGGGPGEMPLFENRGSILLFRGSCSAEVIFDNNSTGIIKGFGTIHSGQSIQNKGQIYAYGGSLVVASEGELINQGVLGNYPLSSLHIRPSLFTEPAADVNNNGTIEVNAGGVAFDCNLVNEPNGVIKLLGGTLAAQKITQSAGAIFEGFGGITGNVIIEPNSITEPNSIIRLTGPTNIVGDVNIPAGATLEISDGQTLITGHTTCKGTIHLIGGTVIFQGGCDCDTCNIIHEAGDDRSHFDINADGIENFEDFATFADTWLWQATWY